MIRVSLQRRLLALLLAMGSFAAGAGQIQVAVASNFIATAQQIAARFEAASGHRVLLSSGSTGKHYAQITHGAPFDVFLAADAQRPTLLEQKGLALPGTRFTYALGRLVLWSPAGQGLEASLQTLQQARFRHLAQANPRLAPYGKAAQQVLQKHGLWQALQGRLVRGENVGQAYQFVVSGNAELGFVAYSQVLSRQDGPAGSLWMVPPEDYQPIAQQAVLLRGTAAARAFFDYLRGEQARSIITAAGYDLP